MPDIVVIKIGGQAAKKLDSGFMAKLKQWQTEGKAVIIVHGGGYAISQLMADAGLPVNKVQGLRVTGQDAMPLVKKALVEIVGQSLVNQLTTQGFLAQEVVDELPRLVTADFLDRQTYGFVGTVSQIDPSPLAGLLEAGVIPLLPSLGYSADGDLLNINADYLATALAQSLQAQALYLLTDVPGVKEEGQVLEVLASSAIAQKIASGVITGGMIPKLESAKATVEAGVATVIISDRLEHGTSIVKG